MNGDIHVRFCERRAEMPLPTRQVRSYKIQVIAKANVPNIILEDIGIHSREKLQK